MFEQIDHTMTSQMLSISKTSTQMDGKIMKGCVGEWGWGQGTSVCVP